MKPDQEFFDVWRERMRENMLGNPEHHLDWRLRRAFYLELGQETAWARAFRGWLAVMCAQKVLPIWLEAIPFDHDALEELGTCIKYLKGQNLIHDFQLVLDMSYHRNEYLTEYFYGSSLVNAEVARSTSLKAIQEIQFWSQKWGWLDPFEHSTVLDANGQPTPDLTDEAWHQRAAVGDAASAAAIAFACTETSSTCDPDKLRAFWTWWLDDGWAMAERLANAYSYPH